MKNNDFQLNARYLYFLKEVLELHNKQSKQVTATAPVAVTSLAFPEAEVNSFFVGSEEGAVYEAYRHGR